MEHCAKVFTSTCAIMQPSLVVALGPGPAAFLSRGREQELDAWKSNTIRRIDRLPIKIIQLEGVTHKTVCIALVHPSYHI